MFVGNAWYVAATAATAATLGRRLATAEEDRTMSADPIYNYTRNGFAGTRTNTVRAGYAPAYTRIEGDYAPRRFDIAGAANTPRGLPVRLLEAEGVSVEIAHHDAPMAFALRNVIADEVHYVVSGQARLETDFGALEIRTGDFVLIPKAIAHRIAAVSAPLAEIVVASAGMLEVSPDPGAVLNVALDVDGPVPFDDAGGEHEVIVRHTGGVTSYFYDFDPLASIGMVGAPQVRRFNIESVRGLGVTNGGIVPGRLIADATGAVLFYHLGSRRSDRPPIHCNADYDEIIVFAGGPGTYGGMDVPGTIAWTPKGIAHHGAEEDVAQPYQAWLLETRASLTMTPAAAALARLMETGEYGIHESAAAPG